MWRGLTLRVVVAFVVPTCLTQAGDLNRARDVYRMALNTVPHKQFTFSKLWLLAAKFEIRRCVVCRVFVTASFQRLSLHSRDLLLLRRPLRRPDTT